MQERNACPYLAAWSKGVCLYVTCFLLCMISVNWPRLGPLKLRDAGSFHHIHAPCLTHSQALQAVVMLLLLLISCICIIATVGQMICRSSCRLSNAKSHGMPMCSSAECAPTGAMLTSCSDIDSCMYCKLMHKNSKAHVLFNSKQ